MRLLSFGIRATTNLFHQVRINTRQRKCCATSCTTGKHSIVNTQKMPPRTPVERYFTLHYSQEEEVCIARHHNGICVVCLTPNHPAVEAGVQRVEYARELKQVSGKRKRGGTMVQHSSIICRVHGGNNLSYNIAACVKGTLLEYNEALSMNPNLVSTFPLSDGYLAVVLPLPRDIDSAVDHLLTENQAHNNKLID